MLRELLFKGGAIIKSCTLTRCSQEAHAFIQVSVPQQSHHEKLVPLKFQFFHLIFGTLQGLFELGVANLTGLSNMWISCGEIKELSSKDVEKVIKQFDVWPTSLCQRRSRTTLNKPDICK